MEGTIAEVRLWASPFQPRNWAYCDGRLLSISTNSALFSLLGTMYGGNGQTTFGLPDLRGRTIVGVGSGSGLPTYTEGEMGGSPTVTLLQSNLPPHNHPLSLTLTLASGSNTSDEPEGRYLLATTPQALFTSGAVNSTMKPLPVQFTGAAGGQQPFSVMQPFLGLSYIICMFGVYPSRN